MVTKWFVIAKVHMSEGAYLSFISSNILPIQSFSHSDDPFLNHIFDNILPNNKELFSESFSSFIAEELMYERLTNVESRMHIKYNITTQQLEFIHIFNSLNAQKVIKNAVAIMSAVNFKNFDTVDYFILSKNDVKNIQYVAELEKKSVKLLVVDKQIDAPSGLIEFYEYIWKTYGSHDSFDFTHIDKFISDKCSLLIDEFFKKGLDHIIKSSSKKNQLCLTSDLRYRTDGVSVLTNDGDIVNGADPYTFVSIGNNYAKDKSNVFYFNTKIESADIDSFKALAWEYAKDSTGAYFKGMRIDNCGNNFKALRPAYGYASDTNTVYYCGLPVEGSDPSYFFAVGAGKQSGGIFFGVDTNHVYLNGKIVPYIDSSSLTYLDYTFFKDRNNVYNEDQIIEDCSPKFAEPVNANYIRDDKSLFFIDGTDTVKINISPFSILKANRFIACDNHYVYYKGNKIDGLSGSSAVINDKHGDGYIYDAKSVFYYDKKISDTPDTFRVLGFGYAYDGANVFFRDSIIPNVDIDSFQITGYGNAFDKNAKYNYNNKLIKQASSDMQRIGGDYYKDFARIYYMGDPIKKADFDTFEVIYSDAGSDLLDILTSESERTVSYATNDYAKDNSNVYFKGESIKSADPETFEILADTRTYSYDKYLYDYSKDSKNIYFQGKKITNVTPNNFRQHDILNVWTDSFKFVKDGNIIPYIDFATFRNIEYNFYCDINSVYFGTNILEGMLPDKAFVINENYIRDDKFIFYSETLPNGSVVIQSLKADNNTFDIIAQNNTFAFDKDTVFFRGTPISGIKRGKAEIVGDNYLTDSEFFYCGNIKMDNVDIKSFQLLGSGYACDNNNVYYQSTVLECKDKMHILGSGYATDGKSFWLYGERVTNPSKNTFIKSILGDIFSGKTLE